MIEKRRWKNNRAAVAAGAALLVALGAAGGAGAVQATRPAIEMAPTTRTAIARLPSSSGVVTVKGQVAEVFGNRFVVQDASGRALVAAGRDAPGRVRVRVRVGQPVMVQGRFADGQLRASYLIDRNGDVAAVGPRGPQPGQPAAPAPHGPGRDGPPPPPPGCAPAPGAPAGPGAVSPPPPPPPASGAGQMPNHPIPPRPLGAQEAPTSDGVPSSGPVGANG